MKKSHRILMALDEAEAPMTAEELAAAIDEPDEAKTVGVLMCSLRNNERVTQVGKEGQRVTWSITERGREFITDVLAEQQDDAATETAASRRVVYAERARRDPDGPMPTRSKKRAAKVNGITPVEHAGEMTPTALTAVVDGHQYIAIREDGALLIVEDGAVAFTLSSELAMRVAGVVRRLRAPE
jgi:hypothetical protein